ncbi:MAG: hypothetical protein JSU79_09245 [Dehalococcoidales bacterium]|nr:MAG: hypothetical protein JSU79_09245 [Dehalococcoidales bacterium]
MTDSFLSQLDRPELENIDEDTGPVDTLNLVSFSNAVRYRWYGFLLSPLILLGGGRPLFDGEYLRSLVGEKTFDELIIIRYPSLRTFVRIVTGRLYSLLNRLRAKGVHYFEFSFTSPLRESSELRNKGHRLVILFNYQEGTFGNVLDKITNILGKYPVIQLYASKKIGVIPFQGMTVFSDPNPSQYEGTVIFSILEDKPEGFTLEEEVITDLKAVTTNLSVDIYRSLSMWESIPWSKY